MKSRRTTRYRNRLSLTAIVAILVVVASLALVGLGIVVSKNRVRALGEEQRKVEDEIRLLRTEIDKLAQFKEKAFASQRVQPRLTKIATMLRPLDEGRILVMPATTSAPVAVALSTDEAPVPDAIPVARAFAQNTPTP
jgi:Tfp pilus assembly protein PilN